MVNRQREIPTGDTFSLFLGPLCDRDRAEFVNFGLGEYGAILKLQEELRVRRGTGRIPDTWLFGEHPAVITQGVRGGPGDIVNPGSGPVGIPVVQIDRGGMTTLHSPGQMILYAIARLEGGSLAAGRMARALLSGLREWLQATHGVEAEIPEGRPGLFVEGRKLLSVGISARSGISMHGVAMNLNNDLSLWQAIVACGEPGTRPVTLSELLGHEVTPQQQGDSIRQWLRTAWGYVEVVEQEVSPSRGKNP